MRYNVVLVVLDTLREDYSAGLRKLEDSGFVKYRNAVAASNWTIPSHASMFTGRLPSSHGMHESQDTHAENFGKMRSANLKVQGEGILGRLTELGYTTHALTANPLVSPVFGFPFAYCDVFDEAGLVTEVRRYVEEARGSWPHAILRMVRDRKAGFLLRRTYKAVKRRVPRILDRAPLEKGSMHIARTLETWKPREPFLLFVNLMEAHQPYSWNDGRPGAQATYCYLTGKRYPLKLDWLKKYREHAELSTSRALDLVGTMQRFSKDTLVIVTADHGQLLGEKGKYDHGYFLDDALVRVPLYVRFPKEMQPFVQREAQVSTSEIPLIVESVLYGTKLELGSNCVVSESFGPQWDIMRFASSDEERRMLLPAYRRKMRIFTQGGSFILDPGSGAIEERQEVSGKDVAACLHAIPRVTRPESGER